MKTTHLLFAATAALLLALSAAAQPKETFCNPLDIVIGQERAYRGGEPVVLIFEDDYFLFVSHRKGYWYSPDFKDWTYVDAPNYPGGVVSVVEMDGALYGCSMNNKRVFKAVDPRKGEWVQVGTLDSDRYGDANMFYDNGHLYLYYGWSQIMPFKVVELDKTTFKEIDGPKVLFFGDHRRHGFESRRNEDVIYSIFNGRRDYFASCAANYRLVGQYLFQRGRAFFNTLLLVILSVVAHLTVNPLAAYALSRFRMRGTEKILLFLLATMAFPAAVTAIPGFLLVRDLGLLNTLAALVLPTVASGMSIFILKGFFDALPRELYEAAAIDGASEWTVFLKITLPMTTPILAVNALNSFVAAYTSWEWAFLVCQKESNWTLAVWMYQMSQQMGGQPWCVMAGFVLVSIPTAIVFLACQKVILRGIVLPSMK